jgi:hypothetical protein
MVFFSACESFCDIFQVDDDDDDADDDDDDLDPDGAGAALMPIPGRRCSAREWTRPGSPCPLVSMH